MWATITNRRADAVNSAWFGRPGTLIKSYPANGTAMLRAGQHPCDGSAAVTGWKLLANGQLQAPADRQNAPGLTKCLTTQGGDGEGGQQWPFTSPIPTTHGQYNGVLHEVGVGQQIVDCSSAQAAGTWTVNSSNGALFHLPPNPSSTTKPTCFSAKPADFHTGAFFGGPKPSVTGTDQCPTGQTPPANTSTFSLTAQGELRVGDGSVCISAVPLYGLQLWSKPLQKPAVAALVLNLLPKDNQTGTVPLADIPGYTADMTLSLDVWTGQVTSLAAGATEVAVSLRPHQSSYFILSAPPGNRGLVATPAVLSAPAPLPTVPRAYETGGWWARLPLKLTTDAVGNSSGDLHGTIAALQTTHQTLVGFDAGVCGTAAVPGDTGTGGVGVDDLVEFLDAAAVQYPDLRVFAGLSSHHPLLDYCPLYLNDQRTDVNWTRVGAVIANRTRGRTNFVGIYIDVRLLCTV
eukprot:SAG22_NODE_983_length_6163_cov_8.370053_5_plen_461_part_00